MRYRVRTLSKFRINEPLVRMISSRKPQKMLRLTMFWSEQKVELPNTKKYSLFGGSQNDAVLLRRRIDMLLKMPCVHLHQATHNYNCLFKRLCMLKYRTPYLKPENNYSNLKSGRILLAITSLHTQILIKY